MLFLFLMSLPRQCRLCEPASTALLCSWASAAVRQCSIAACSQLLAQSSDRPYHQNICREFVSLRLPKTSCPRGAG